jgi:hypothetical protein
MHSINIFIHVLAGTLALVTGIIALTAAKGGNAHVLSGRFFARLVAIVIATGLIGVLVFGRNNFLLVITLLSGYNCFSGIRVIRLKGRAPDILDQGIAVAVMVSALYYLYFIRQAGFYWAAAVVLSTVGALFLVTTWDLARAAFSAGFRRKALLYEHVYKMVSAFSGILSAFTGTVFPHYQPYSQLLPSAMGLGYIIVIFIRLSNQRVCTQP